MNPFLNLPNILVSFESSIKSQIRVNKDKAGCPKMRVSRELVDNLNLLMNRFIKQTMSSALLIVKNKKQKTITENDLNLVFHTMLHPYFYKWSNNLPTKVRRYYKEHFLDNPNPKKPATLKDKYDPFYMEEMNPYQVEKAMRLLLPAGYRINEMAIVLMTVIMFRTFEFSLFLCIDDFCDLLKDKNYKGPRTLTYDRFKETLKTHYDYELKYPNIKFYDIGNICKLLP